MFGVDFATQEGCGGSQISVTSIPELARRVFPPDEIYKSVHALDRAQQIFARIP
jgi:hypothetical protein